MIPQYNDTSPTNGPVNYRGSDFKESSRSLSNVNFINYGNYDKKTGLEINHPDFHQPLRSDFMS